MREQAQVCKDAQDNGSGWVEMHTWAVVDPLEMLECCSNSALTDECSTPALSSQSSVDCIAESVQLATALA